MPNVFLVFCKVARALTALPVRNDIAARLVKITDVWSALARQFRADVRFSKFFKQSLPLPKPFLELVDAFLFGRCELTGPVCEAIFQPPEAPSDMLKIFAEDAENYD